MSFYKYIYILFILIFVYSSCYIKCDEIYWNHALFVQSWPPYLLKNTTINYPYNNNYFVINSIMAIIPNGSIPVYCDDRYIFNKNNINSIYDELYIYWTNFTNHVGFLRETYDKYFSCIKNEKIYDEYIYFKFGLELYKKYNFYMLLAYEGIYPSNTNKYSTKIFAETLYRNIFVYPLVICDNNGYLQNIIICFNREMKHTFCPYYLYEKYECKKKYIIYNEYHSIHKKIDGIF